MKFMPTVKFGKGMWGLGLGKRSKGALILLLTKNDKITYIHPGRACR